MIYYYTILTLIIIFGAGYFLIETKRISDICWGLTLFLLGLWIGLGF